jgi:membrane protease YdiL (CAAX protease family)
MPLVAVAVVVVLVGVGAWLGFQPERGGTPAFWVLVGAPTVVLASIAAWRAHKDGDLAEWLKPKWGDFSRAFFAAGLLFASAYGFARIVCATGSPREIFLVSLYGQIGDPRVLQQNAIAVGVGIVVLAIAEEILWRGAVTQLLEEKIGSSRAWIVSAALYALAHVPTMWSLRAGGGALNPIMPLAALAAGLLFGAMARRFDRLAPGIVAHALFDWLVVMMFPLWGLPRGV